MDALYTLSPDEFVKNAAALPGPLTMQSAAGAAKIGNQQPSQALPATEAWGNCMHVTNKLHPGQPFAAETFKFLDGADLCFGGRGTVRLVASRR
jgi:hypothetical protein